MRECMLKKLNALHKGVVLGVILFALMIPVRKSWSQTNVSRAAPGRYLFIVETSHTMSRRSDRVLKTVGNLLHPGMNGQIRHCLEPSIRAATNVAAANDRRKAPGCKSR